jgi:hypothetical protein
MWQLVGEKMSAIFVDELLLMAGRRVRPQNAF